MALNPDLIEACRIHVIKGNSVKDASLKYGVSKATLEKIATRQGWVQSKRMIKEGHEKFELGLNQKVESRMVEKASLRVASHLEQVFSTGSNFMKQLEQTLGGLALGPVTDAQGAVAAITAYGKADSLVRRSLGLGDTVEVHHSGQVDMNVKCLSILAAVRNQETPMELPDDKALEVLAKKLEDESKQ